MKYFKTYFKNRKTLKFKSLILWAYIFLIYLLLRPTLSNRNIDHLLSNTAIYTTYLKLPIYVYSIINIASIIELLKIIKIDFRYLFNYYINSIIVFIKKYILIDCL